MHFGKHWDIIKKRNKKIEELIISLDDASKQIGELYNVAAQEGFRKKYRGQNITGEPLFYPFVASTGRNCNLCDISSIPLDLTNKKGESALSIAAELGDVKVLKRLIRVGAKVTETALSNAVINQHEKCIVMLLKCNAEFSESLLRSLLQVPSETVFKVFLEAEKNATYRAENVETMTVRTLDEPILHKAVRFQITEAVRWLISAGADVHKRNHRNETALTIAVQYSNMDLIKELLLAEGILSKSENEIVIFC